MQGHTATRKSGNNPVVDTYYASIRWCPNMKCHGIVFVIEGGSQGILEVEPATTS